MRIFTVGSQELGKEETLRCDTDFLYFQHHFLIDEYYSFSDLFEFSKNNKVNTADLNDDFYYCEIGDVEKDGDIHPVLLNLNNRLIEYADYYKKIEKGDIIRAKEGDILIAKVRPYKYVYVTEEKQNIYYTSAFIHLVPKKMNKVLYYVIKYIYYEDLLAISRQGKSYPTLNKKDLLYLKFDKNIINRLLENETRILTQIEPIEQEIQKLKQQIRSPQEIINEVFAEEFGFDLEKFEELRRERTYFIDLSNCANNKDLRQSVKFHKEAGVFVWEELKKVTNKRIKHFLAEPIVLGAGISPSEYDEDGKYYYISMASIKNWEFEKETARLVSGEYASKHQDKAIRKNDIILAGSGEYASKHQDKAIRKNDIILARSGEATIGKVALIEEEDINGIFSNFTMRIRLSNCNPLFAYYYFRTKYFQYLIEINKKGLSITNIFPSQIQEFPMIAVDLKKQHEIVDKIKEEINRYEEVKKQIETKKDEINEIIKKHCLQK